MKRALAITVAAVAILAGCGSDITDLLGGSCTSGGAPKVQPASTTCTLQPGNATINVRLCADCFASSAGCIPEFQPDGSLELAPNVCTADSSASCSTDASGCNAGVRQAVCSVTIPSGGSASRPMVIVGKDNQLINGQLNISPTGSTSCTL